MTGARIPRMPDLTGGTHAFHHTLDSALAILDRAGVSATRVTVMMAGRGYPSHWVVEQTPPPGTPLTPDVEVRLAVAGLGFFESLPVGMWESGGEPEPGTREIISIIDDPVQKALHWVREGARYFDVRPDNPGACASWIRLFGVDPENWPRELWYTLAAVLPSLHRLAGREEGFRFALDTLFHLPLAEVLRLPRFRRMAGGDVSLLGVRAGRLGVDYIAGDRIEDVAEIALVLGPVTLSTYRCFQESETARLLQRALALCAPWHQPCSIRWLIGDRSRAPRLGFEEQNARLGINTHMGAAATRPLR